MEITAFEKNVKVSLVILNRTDKKIPFFLRIDNQYVSLLAEAESIATGTITLTNDDSE